MYSLTHKIRSHAEQTDDRQQVHEKAHEGTPSGAFAELVTRQRRLCTITTATLDGTSAR